ncbi:MAG: beta-galactosidase [Bryobacteraceae bacterium]
MPPILAAAMLWAPVAAQSAQPAPSAFFPAAVWYGGGKARAPMMSPLNSGSAAEWGNDLDQIKAVGFNTIKCWVDWATAEPKPGVFDFKNLELLLKLADERGLRVIIQIYLDSAPDWVGHRYPEGRFVDRSGAIVTSQSAPGYCIDHEGVRREIVKFLETLSRDANRSQSLYGWDVWSEPHVINWADFSWLAQPEFCFCPGSQARFRQWLRTKYNTLDALNAAWYRKFESWDQVEAPRFSTILSYADYMDWRAFIDDKLAGDLKTRTEAIRSADRTHPISSHAGAPGLFTSPTDGYGEPDDWKMSASTDFYGTSLYPRHSESARPWPYWMLAAGLDFTRSAGHAFGKGFWIGELQAGQGATGMRIVEPVTAHDEEFWMWQAVAHGAREIANYAWYPMSSGFESNGYGLINLDGTLTDRARAAGRVAAIVGRNARRLNQAQPAPAEVAILYDRLSYMVGGRQPSPSTLGNAERDSLLGLYRAFFETGIPVDFVHPMALDADRLRQYKLLFLPYPVMLPRGVADVLKQYVKQGGTVVAEARLAWNDERGFASPVVPGFGLDELFGAREILIRPEAEPKMLLSGLLPGQTALGAAFEEHLKALPGAQVLATFPSGDAAIVQKAYGHGKAILAGTFLGLAYQRNHDASTRALLLAIAGEALSSMWLTAVQEVEVRRLIGDGYQFVFVFNHGNEKNDYTLELPLPWRARVRDLLTGEDVPNAPVEARGYGVRLHRPLLKDGIWVIELERQ